MTITANQWFQQKENVPHGEILLWDLQSGYRKTEINIHSPIYY